MSVSGAGRRGWARLAGLAKTMGQERAFSLVEMASVVIIIGIMLGVVLIAYTTATKGTDVMAAAEQLKQALRRAYSMTDSGEKTTGYRNRYRINFHDATGAPPNAYQIEKGTSNDGSAWTWTQVSAEKGSSYRILANNWVTLSSDAGTNLSSNVSTITYISRGSIMEAEPFGAKQVTVSSAVAGKNIVINVSDYGSLSQ